MAAAAYSDQPEICVNNTFANASLYRNVNITCDTHGKNDVCAGFTAVSHNDSAIILSFRGTNSFTQLLLESGDTTCEAMVKSPIGGKVGAYFMDVFERLWINNSIGSDLLSLKSQYPNYELWITGHSLGGALATLAAAHVIADRRYDRTRLKLFTLGQPRTGNREFAQGLDELLPPNSTYRITHSRDPVVHLPPHSYKNYTHNIAEVWYYNDMNENATYTAICSGDGESRNCSGQIHYVFSVSDHVKYFGTTVSLFGINGFALILITYFINHLSYYMSG
ncbi:lipase (class 3) domain-containing protein [Ditylenchus destructor]|uniref:Lipase (Class 3) domain-containing protein n=1 Tax=Ditylenchus destructor TaxID=166010 RepID=A0AAD4RD50_9BILA|nr:lipase (class 3) domain-containing protein [Ditylenchus destructor]